MTNRLAQMASGAATPPVRSKASRVRVLAFGFVLAFCAVGVRVGLLSADGLNVGGRSAEAMLPIAQPMLRDVNGEILARTLPSRSLMADPKMVLDPAETARSLATVLPNIDVAALTERLSSNRRFEWVARHLTPGQSQAIPHLGLPGLRFVSEGKRFYMQGRNMSHVVGFRGIDGQGLAGVEAYLDKSGLGRAVESDNGILDLTLDGRLQQVLHEELKKGVTEFRAKAGAGIILDVRTGGIAALVSLPDFDPYRAGERTKEQQFNNASQGTYELGSIFKIINTAIALDSGTVKLTDRFDATKPYRISRHTIRDYAPQNRWLTVAETFKHSSNIASAQIALAMGPEIQKSYFDSLGLLTRPNLEVVEVDSPQLPPNWSETYSATMSYGYGLSVSLVQMASAVATAVHDGIYRPPTLLKSLAQDDGRGHRVFSEKTVDTMRRLLRVVVTDGTGRRAEVAGYLPGGKTGTAEQASGRGYDQGRLLSSFVAGFPINRPEYVVLVSLIEPKGNEETNNFSTAGWVAAPIAGRVIGRVGPILGIAPVDAEDPAIVQAMQLSRESLPKMVKQ
ncbi:MAG: penicillin-binding protein 2 [Pseudomonadota bacterium]